MARRRRSFRIGPRGAALALAATSVLPATSAPAADEIAFTCTNPASGATWEIKVDFGRSTVDSNPAKVSDTAISWRDAKDGGNYTLDRKSGALTVIVASSTGGYFVYDRCRQETAR